MTDQSSDFDAEVRRRWYAAALSAAATSSFMVVLFIRLQMEGVFSSSGDPVWEIAIVCFGIALFFFVLKYVAAYALWYRPYASRGRAISLSLCAIFAVYLCIFGGFGLFAVFKGARFDIAEAVQRFWEFQVLIYGAPYLAAILVGWFFAKPKPDVRKQF